jgi:hypothetical protein
LQNNVGNVCLVSVDGTDFRIYEWKPFWKGWFSHKFRGPGLRYEVGLCIRTGWIVWIHGPFPCGKWADLTIFRKALKVMLPPGEKVHADLGYIGEPNHIVVPIQVDANDMAGKEAQHIAASVRARHETVNKRFKQFEILKRVFRHDVQHHQPVFGACAVITQMAIERGEPLYPLDYDESMLQVRF